ncbi:MAG: hypothetical protein A2075_18325 [Geobacteraceae bacterium GWC2_58_44]|nr:MAG: hypothetical protein A2075_18325 [Geobacteraceae bacterium GWC2_58_44]HBG08187.1 DUF490 domain-containing protein [Geobacter sp.]
MRRAALYIGCALAGLLLLCLLGLFWLLDTTAGARFAVTALTGAAGFNISMQGVEGRLLDRLHLTGVRVSKPQLRAQIDRLDLAWEPRQLWNGHLQVHELAVSGVRVQDDRPATTEPPQLRWPRVSAPLRGLSAQLSRLKVKDLSYRHLEAAPLLVTELTGSLHFKDGLLSASQLSLLSPDGRVSGEIAAGLWHPSLRLDLAVVPAQPVQELDFFSLQARLLPGRLPEQLAGGIVVAGRSGGARRLELTGELGIAVNALNLRRLKLSRPGSRGTLTGDVSMLLSKPEPLFSLALRATDLDLAKELKLQLPTRLSGTVTFSGSLSNFLGSFDLANSGPGWQTASLAAQYRGGPTGVKLAPLTGKLLDGRLRGALEVAWSEGLRISGNLAGRGLNPGRLAAQWPGLVNLDLAGKLEMPEQGVARGELRGKLLESRLHGRDLQGELVAAFAGERLRIDRLLLRGRGFNLQGAGELDRRLNLAARVSDLSGLVPGAAGQLQADGWVRWRDGLFSGAASGQGANLAAAGVSAAALRLDARLGEGKSPPVYLDASLNRLRVGRFQADSALLTLQGTPASHTLTAKLSSSSFAEAPADSSAFAEASASAKTLAELRVALSGGYRDGVWRGELTRFSGRDGVGPWSLAAPTPLMLSAQRMRIAPLVINGLPGERVEVAGELERQPLSGAVRGAWGGLNLARANAWLDGVQLAGASSGDLSLRLLPGERLILTGRAEAKGTLVADGQRVDLERLAATLQGDAGGLRAAVDLTLAGGDGEAHLLFTSTDPASLALPKRGDLTLNWSEFDLALLRPVTPAGLIVDGRSAGLVRGKLLPGSKLELRGNAALDQGHLNWRAEGDELDASIDSAELSFSWRGGTQGAGKGGAGLLTLNARAAATGLYTSKGQRIALIRGTLRADADEQGSRAGLDLTLEEGGALRVDLSSDSPASLGIPETGDLAMEWGGIDPALLKPWLPGTLDLQGEFAGEASGRLLPGKRLEMAGQAEFSQGRAKWQGENGEVSANLRSANLSWNWRGETLSGALSLALAEYGQARGSFVLPIPARLPLLPDRNGALQGALAGRVQERGFLTAFLPGLVQESHGDLDLDLKLAGTWSDPRIAGSLQLSKAGAYLPTAGIRVSDVQLMARLEGDQVRIDNFRAVSGAGHIEGNLEARLEGWQVAEYSGTLSGERFQTVYLPELQMVTSPQLSFKGGGDSVTLRGELRVPEMLVSGPPVRQIVTPSGDVIMEGAPPASEGKPFPLALDGRIRVVLGEKVEVKASGIDAQLGGSMDLVLQGVDSITSSGEIRVVKGRYRAYGMDLEIVRGRVYYVDDPVDQPTLDILALRKVGDVRAGVTVAGFLKAPIVKLYSEPPMPEVDILAYMVLGHPLGASSEQGNMVAMAATSLFSLGESSSVQEQIKDRLGLSVLGVETVDTAGVGLMGYKEIPVTPTGEAQARPAAAESLLTVGKYLTPQLYLSYGRSLITGGNLFMLRYDISRRWQLETQSGSESGLDLYYKLEFN